MLKIEISPGESIQVGHDVVVTLDRKTGQTARLSFEADRSIPIRRIEAETPSRRTFGITGEAK